MRKVFFAILFLSFSSQGQTTVFTEDFAAGIPAGFTLIDNDGLTPHADVSEFVDAWIAVVDPDSAMNTVAASTSYFDPAGIADRWLITPPITLGTFGNFLTWNARSQDASFLDTYYILISTTGTTVSDFNDTLNIVVSEGFEWSAREIDLSEHGYDGQTVYVAFVNKTNDGFKLYIDDIEVRVDDPVGVETIQIENVAVYPNPFSAQLNYYASGLKQAILYDLHGAIVQVTELDFMSTAALNSGAYILEIQTEQGIYRRRVIKN